MQSDGESKEQRVPKAHTSPESKALDRERIGAILSIEQFDRFPNIPYSKI